VSTETVELLKASKAGNLKVVARGHGADRVRLSLRNTSTKRLNVVLPPGLVAASTAGQGRGGGGLQSIGLGMMSNRPGSFGLFQGTQSSRGLSSVPVERSLRGSAVAVPVGETLELTLPGVCLNYGLPAPSGHHTFKLMDVDDYSTDTRVRKALRSLCLYGTSQGVAQAVMWRVCNNLPFETMASEASNVMNQHEIALAARFVESVEESGEGDLVDSSQWTHDRVFVWARGEGAAGDEARRLSDQLEKSGLFGLPAHVVDDEELPTASGPALYLRVVLGSGKAGEMRGRVAVSYCSVAGEWMPLGKATLQESASLSAMDGETLSRAVERAVATAFVSVKPAKRSVGSTTLRVENRLPFTLSGVTLKAGNSAGSPTVPYEGVGIGPARSALLPIQAAGAVIERVELNGL
jgi:hypothetical protein